MADLDADRLAELVAGKARVRIGGQEGTLDGFAYKPRNPDRCMYRIIPDDGGEPITAYGGTLEVLQEPDPAVVAAHWEQIKEQDRATAELKASGGYKGDVYGNQS